MLSHPAHVRPVQQAACQHETAALVFGWIFFGVGMLTLLSLLQWAIGRMLKGGRTRGTVVDVQMMPGVQGSDVAPHVYYRPIVRYAVDGRDYQVAGGYLIQESETRVTVRGDEFKQYDTMSLLPRYQTGQALTVIYDRANPAQAEVVDRRREIQIIVAQSFFGLMFTAIGLLVFLLNGNLGWIGPEWQR